MLLTECVALALTLTAVDANPAASAGHVAVLACDDFYYPNANFAFTADTCVETLRACEIPARRVTPKDLEDAQSFNADNYPVLLNIYGDAYPESSLPALRRYHAQGGCVINNGVPFGFACQHTKKRWEGAYLPEDRSARTHTGMGTGWWTQIDKPTRVRWAVDPAASPIRLESFHPESTRIGRFYGLDPASLPAQDKVIPLIVVQDEQQQAIAVGIIEHCCSQFDGAIDVWAGAHLFSEPRHNVIRTQEEIFVRACAYLLERTGTITPAHRARIDAAMDRRLADQPADPDRWPMPTTSAIAPPQRIVPAAQPPAGHLDVIDLQNADPELQRTALCLAGLANRTQARLFVICRDIDDDWLSYLAEKESPDLKVTPLALEDAFGKYADVYNGAVIPPDKTELFCGINVAVMAAAARDLVVASEETAHRYQLPVREDLRRRWTTTAAAYRWIDAECAPNLRRDLAAVCSPEKWLFTDYLVAHRIYTLWVTGPRDAAEAGANTWDEIRLAYNLLAEMPLHAPVFGFGHHALYRGLGESETVEIISRFAKFQMVTNATPNLSVYSSFPRSPLKQKRRQPPALNPDRVYVAIVLSDGDNLNYWYSRFPELWKDPARGTFPVGWSIGPAGLDLEPPMYRRIYDQATENDCFVAAVSGLAYIYPEIYGQGYTDSRELLDEFLRRTRTQMDLMDLRAIHVHHHGPYGGISPDTLEHYAAILDPGKTDLICTGYGRHDWFPADPGRPRFVNTVPLAYAATTGKPAEAVAQIQQAAGTSRPAFIYAHLTPWRFKPAEWKNEFDKLGPEYVLVTPEELGQLARQWGTPDHK